MVSFHGTTVTPSVAQELQRLAPGGVTLFGQNFSSPSQVSNLDSGTAAGLSMKRINTSVTLFLN